MSDGAGKPPVVIVKEQTNITSGTDVQEKLIAASEVFANLLKPTFGPMGLDKMLYKTDGNPFPPMGRILSKTTFNPKISQ